MQAKTTAIVAAQETKRVADVPRNGWLNRLLARFQRLPWQTKSHGRRRKRHWVRINFF